MFIGYVEDEDSDKTRNTKVSVYEIGPGPDFKFQKTQVLYHQNIRSLKYLEMSQTTYLALGAFSKQTPIGRQYSSPSQILIMRYDPLSNYFHFHSSLPGSGVVDLEFFQIGSKSYLIVANQRDNFMSLDIFSFVFAYNVLTSKFELTQYISTHGARDIEYFKLASEHYIVIANEGTGKVGNMSMSSYSDVYKLDNEKFELIQNLETYGAVKWESIPVPNCKHDVLLVYADQRNNIDQVGIYSFSHDEESFKMVPFSIYHLENINDTYRPMPRTLATFQTQDSSSGEFRLFLIIGANDTSEGSSIYQLSYDVILTDSPLDAFQRKVAEELAALNGIINEVKNLLDLAKKTLDDAVLIGRNETIVGKKTFIQEVVADHAEVSTLHLKTGSIYYFNNDSSYRVNPEIAPFISVSGLYTNASRLNNTLSDILVSKDQLMYLSVDQNITGKIIFDDVIGNQFKISGNLLVTTGLVNSINVTELFNEIVTKNSDTNITSEKTFKKSIQVDNDFNAGGKINNISFPNDIVTKDTEQNITGRKVFINNITVKNNLTCKKINSIDIKNDVVYTNEPANIYGSIQFNNDTEIFSLNAGDTINDVDIQRLLTDTMLKSVPQNITGYKNFTSSIYSGKDVLVNALVNGLDLKQLQQDLEMLSNRTVLYGPKIFLSNITILNDMHVTKTINGWNFPEDFLSKSTSQKITAPKVFKNVGTFLQSLNVTEQVDNIYTEQLVTLDGNQVINGEKHFDKLFSGGDIVMIENKTVNNLDWSEFSTKIIFIHTDEDLDAVTFKDDVTIYGSNISGLINGKSKVYYKETYDESLHVIGNQNITGFIVIDQNVNVTKDIVATFINGYTFPDGFAKTDVNQTFNGEKAFTNTTYFTQNIKLHGHLDNIDIVKFNNDIIDPTSEQVVAGIKSFNKSAHVKGNIYINGMINDVKFSTDLMNRYDDQEITSAKNFSAVIVEDKHVTAYEDILVATTIDDVDLSELDLSAMTKTRNETATGEKCFAQTDYNNSVNYINGIDLSALANDIVTVNTEQTISSSKTFETIFLQQHLNTTSVIDGVDLSELFEDTIKREENSSIAGYAILKGNLNIDKNLETDYLDGINITNIEQNLILKSRNEAISILTINNSITTNDVVIKNVNDLNIETDIAFKSRDQTINGFKTIGNVTVKNLTTGLINNINISELHENTVYKNIDQSIYGEIQFGDNVTIKGNLTNHLINGFDLQSMGIALKNT